MHDEFTKLKNEGFDVDTAYDGEEAVQKVDEYDPDLMILDLMLPKKDGLEVAREVRQTHDMPIIMVTAKDTEIAENQVDAKALLEPSAHRALAAEQHQKVVPQHRGRQHHWQRANGVDQVA